MKTTIRLLALGLATLGLAAATALAGSQSCITSGTLTAADNNTHVDNFVVVTTASTTISSYGWVDTYHSCGGGAHCDYNHTTFVFDYALSDIYSYNTNSAYVTGKPAGEYELGQGCNGVTGSSYDIETNFSW